MAGATLKSLHAYLRLLENPAELKRKMPDYSHQRSIREGLSEMGKLVGIDNVAFKDQQNIAAVIGPQRFVMIWGEPSVTAHVARIFDSSKVLVTVLIDPGHFGKATTAPAGLNPGPARQPAGASPQFAGWAQSKAESSGLLEQSNPDPESALESLKPLLAGNLALTSRLFRALFEHMLGFASPAIAQQGSTTLVNELTGSKEHGRPFLATAMFILGAEIDRENLMSFMLEQGLFGLQLFEQLLQNREYCDAYYTFRKLERAFVGSPAEEEKQLRNRMDRFNEQYGGKPGDVRMFETGDQDKARVDAHFAAVDLLETMALTPLSLCLNNAIAAAPSNTVRSMEIMARHFECFAAGKETKEQANQEIADHLFAFARQFSPDSKAAPLS
jgi:hypothetical protein